jgi:fatty acid desaturase
MGESRSRLSRKQLIILQKPKISSNILRVILIILSYLLICKIILMYPLSGILLIPFLGFILSGFLNAAHFYLHREDIKPQRRRMIGVLWCIPILANFTSFERRHLAHHRITGVEGDPDLHPDYKNIFEYLYSHSGITLWANTFKAVFRRALWRYDRIKNDRKPIFQENWAIVAWIITVAIFLFYFPKVLLLCYLGPLLFYPIMVVFFSLPEHYGINGTDKISLNTRSVISNGIVRFYQWNANYHAEHHFYPTIDQRPTYII